MSVIAVPKKPNGAWRQAKLGIVAVSVGQPYHEGDNIGALVSFAENNFTAVTVLVADTLQRWNSSDAANNNWHVAYDAAKAAGDAWLERHQTYINNIPIKRWDSHMAAPGFQASLVMLAGMATTNIAFNSAITGEATRYLARKSNTTAPPSPNALSNCRSYIFEEMAADMAAANSEPTAIIYPFEEPRSYRALRHAMAERKQAHYLRWCHVRLVAAA